MCGLLDLGRSPQRLCASGGRLPAHAAARAACFYALARASSSTISGA